MELVRHLNTYDFRGALAIDQPTLFLDEAGRPVMVECLALVRVGSTAMLSLGFTIKCGDLLKRTM